MALGKRYELAAQQLLHSLGMDTRIVGGSQDGGVDICGHWPLSATKSPPIPVIVQCKRIKQKAGCPPSFLRELEGSLAVCRQEGTIGIMVCSLPASKSTMEAIVQSTRPLMYLHYDEVALRRAFVNGSLQRMYPRLVIASKHNSDGLVEPCFFYRDE